MSGFEMFLENIVEAGELTSAIATEFPGASICFWPRNQLLEWPFPNEIGVITAIVEGEFPYWIDLKYWEESEPEDYGARPARICKLLGRRAIISESGNPDPYEWTLISETGERSLVQVDAEMLDEDRGLRVVS